MDNTRRLYPDELAYITRSAQIRRNTFSTGRACAREALKEAGLPEVPLPREDSGSIIWPGGVVGSVSHTDEWAVAAVAVQAMSDVRAIGIDLERILPLEADVLSLIATSSEQLELVEGGKKHWHATALFSLKESLYKCLRSAYDEFIEFHDVEIRDLASGRPRVEFANAALRQLCDPDELVLRMAVTPAHVFSLVWWRQ